MSQHLDNKWAIPEVFPHGWGKHLGEQGLSTWSLCSEFIHNKHFQQKTEKLLIWAIVMICIFYSFLKTVFNPLQWWHDYQRNLLLLLLFYYYYYYFICSGFCHTLKWNIHGFTCVPHPDPPYHLPLHLLPLGLPSAPGLSACLMHPTWAGDLFHPR